MLIFVIPLKSKLVAKSWPITCQLFERTLRSACNQTSANFRVVVVCRERPAVEFSHDQVDYIEVNFLPPEKEKHPITRGLTDKGRKVLKGLIHAQQFSPSHAMVLDSDDCVSNRLAAFVETQQQANGWYFHSGFKYREREDFIYIKWRNFYRMSGTSSIIRFDLLDLPKVPEYNRGYGYYKFYVDHQKVITAMANRERPIKSLPFPGAVYILSGGENMSGNDDNLSFNFLNRKCLNAKLSDEFSLYKL